MPIGKNAIKRVENNGYSKVKSTAPDMENSEVVVAVEPAPAVVEPVPAPVFPKPSTVTRKVGA